MKFVIVVAELKIMVTGMILFYEDGGSDTAHYLLVVVDVDVAVVVVVI